MYTFRPLLTSRALPSSVVTAQPHLHTIVNRSMELALTAKDPYNYFLLLRALFRSIGGGSHDLLYQEFLPLLKNLLQGQSVGHDLLYQEFLPLLKSLLQGQ